MKDETILPPVMVTPTQHSLVAALTKNARLLVFMLSELKLLQGGGKVVETKQKALRFE